MLQCDATGFSVVRQEKIRFEFQRKADCFSFAGVLELQG
jgi:hypothetical protein